MCEDPSIGHGDGMQTMCDRGHIVSEKLRVRYIVVTRTVGTFEACVFIGKRFIEMNCL